MSDKIAIEVAYALPDRQVIIPLEVEADCSMRDAVRRSGIIERFPEIDPDAAKMGVFGKVVTRPDEARLEPGQRIEIYRPLIADPKAVRKERAAKAKARRAAAKSAD